MDGRAGAPSNRRRNLLTTGDLVAGRFRLGRRVGEGGFGQVFEAADEQWGDRRVAVKILSPAAASDPEFRARFEREALSAEVAAHRHVLPVLSSGREGEFFYIAMPFVPESLADVLGDHGRLPPERALRLCTQVALALDWAHSRGIVHRDVKPANVLLEHDATVGDHAYLADFGIAKAALAATVTRTEFGVPFSGFYGAPEQWLQGEPGTPPLGPRTDQYALAVTLYECLAGRRPFQAASGPELGLLHLKGQAPSLAPVVGAGSARAVDAALARGMAKHPDGRFESCRGMVAAVAAALAAPGSRDRDLAETAPEPLPPPPPPPPPPAQPPHCVRAPRIVGPARVGAPLRCDPGDWRNASHASVTFAWRRLTGTAVVPLPGAHASAYVPTPSDRGSRIVAEVSVRTGGHSARADTPATAKVAGAHARRRLVVLAAVLAALAAGGAAIAIGFGGGSQSSAQDRRSSGADGSGDTGADPGTTDAGPAPPTPRERAEAKIRRYLPADILGSCSSSSTHYVTGARGAVRCGHAKYTLFRSSSAMRSEYSDEAHLYPSPDTTASKGTCTKAHNGSGTWNDEKNRVRGHLTCYQDSATGDQVFVWTYDKAPILSSLRSPGNSIRAVTKRWNAAGPVP